MTDGEVIRLRELRKTALRARAIASALGSHEAQRNSVFFRSAQNCWQIARTITGRLRAHPYLSFQRGPSEARAAYDRISAIALSRVARYRGRSMQFYCEELRRVARELDDARALTWSPDLSDDFGRLQTRIHRLIREVEVAAHLEAGLDAAQSPRIETQGRMAASDVDAAAVDDNWPYLAF